MKIDKVPKMDKQVVDKFLDGSLTVKESDKIKEDIVDRCNYIVRSIWQLQGYGKVFGWWDFANEGGKDGPSGYFDRYSYREIISTTGEVERHHEWPYDMLYNDGFPTKWLWEDFEDALVQEATKFKEDEKKKKETEKQKRVEREAKKKELIASALTKLTPEEARAMGYRKPKK
jgi:hypothetical protein